MKGRLLKNFSRGIGLLGLIAVLLLVGCGTPRERYRVLSVFFDGVPDPDAPKVQKVVQSSGPEAPAVIQAGVLSRHKPFVENKCDQCHRSAGGEIQEFDEAYKVCIKCHKDVPTQYAKMHGPVALASCKWCHAPHESNYPALLKDEPIKVCTQCHDQNLLGNDPPQHTDGTTSCISCHAGHGGHDRYFLKPGYHPQTPATRATIWPALNGPATAPATAPATTLPAASGAPIGQAAGVP